MTGAQQREAKRRAKRKEFVSRKPVLGLQRREARGQPRSAFRPTVATTTGPEQEQEGGGAEALTGMFAIKEGWDQGQQVQEGITSGAYADKFSNAADRVGGWFNFGQQPDAYTALSGTYSRSVPGSIQTVTQPYSTGSYGANINPRFASQFTQPVAGGVQSYGAGLSGSIPRDFGIQGGSDWASAIANTGAEGSTLLQETVGLGSDFAGGDLYTGLDTTSLGTTATGAEASILGEVGSLAGMGLSAYDMSPQGITAGNMMGLLGSGILAGTTMLGLANAWNPVGWALLAGSAAGSIFDWW